METQILYFHFIYHPESLRLLEEKNINYGEDCLICLFEPKPVNKVILIRSISYKCTSTMIKYKKHIYIKGVLICLQAVCEPHIIEEKLFVKLSACLLH